MIDAYEIGIRLALENGVSEGLAVIRRDLGILDAAIARSAAGLIGLQQLAGGLIAPNPPVVRQPAPPPERATPADPSEPPRPTPLPTLPLPLPVDPVKREAQAANASSVSPAAPIPISPDHPAGLPAHGSREADRGPDLFVQAPLPFTINSNAPKEQAPAPRALPAAPEVRSPAASPLSQADPPQPLRPMELNVPAAPRSEPVIQSAPVLAPQTTARVEAVSAAAPPSRSVENARDGSAASRPTASTPKSPPPVQAVQRPQVPADVQLRPVRTSGSVPIPSPSPIVNQPVAAASPQPPVSMAPPPRVERPRPMSRPADPKSNAAESQVKGGDIYLEGAVLGRWLADRLARAVSRPASGTTAFDPRVSPTWPGPAIGN